MGDNIKMDCQEMGWVRMDWIDLSQDREVGGGDFFFVNVLMDLQVP
jgi:hypothetical protein